MKVFAIKLSDTTEKIVAGVDQQGKDVSKGKRETEVIILKNLFEISANNQKEISKANECLDCKGAVENLTDDEQEIKFTKADIEYLKDGFEKTAGGRPAVWFSCRELLKQIEKPDERDE